MDDMVAICCSALLVQFWAEEELKWLFRVHVSNSFS